MNKDRKVKLISRTTAYKRFHSLDEVVLQPTSLKDGSFLEPMDREVLQSGKAAVIIPYIPETDQIILNEQFRVGAYFSDAENPWLIELAGGIMDEGETPEQTAIREGFEETGAKVLDTEFIASIYPTPGSVAEEIFLYCGHISTSTKTGIFGEFHEGEEIQTKFYNVSDIEEMLDNNEIKNGTSYCALSWFIRHHKRLKEKWSS